MRPEHIEQIESASKIAITDEEAKMFEGCRKACAICEEGEAELVTRIGSLNRFRCRECGGRFEEVTA